MAKSDEHGIGRTFAAIAGAPLAALTSCLAVGGLFPEDSGVGVALAEVGVYPVAALASAVTLVARSSRRAWLGCAAVITLAVLVLALTRWSS